MEMRFGLGLEWTRDPMPQPSGWTNSESRTARMNLLGCGYAT
jgi:hypothetical protein